MEGGFDPNFDLHVDPSPLLHIDMDAVERALRHISFPKFGEKPLGLSDLDAVDWDAVASSLLGVSDPIGQLEQWLSSVLNSFFSDLKNFISSALSPISDAINNVSNIVSTIKDALSSLANWLSNVIVAPIMNALNWVSNTFPQVVSAVKGLISTVQGFITTLPDMVKDAANRVSDMFNSLASKIQSGLSTVIDQISKVPGMVSDLASRVVSAFSDLTNTIKGGLSSIIDQVSKLPDIIKNLKDSVASAFGDLTDKVKGGLTDILNTISKLPGLISDLKDKVVGAFSDLTSAIKGGLSDIQNMISKLPDLVKDFINKVTGAFSDLKDKIVAGLGNIADQVAKLPDLINDLKDKVMRIFSDLADKVKGGFSWFIDQVSHLPDMVKDLVSNIVNTFSDLADKVKGGFSWFIDQVSQLPDRVRDIASKIEDSFKWFIDQVVHLPGVIKNVTDNLIGDVENGVGGIVGWIKSEFENVRSTIDSWFTGAKDWFDNATKDLKALGAAFMGFVNAVQNLPGELEIILQPITAFFEGMLNSLEEFAKDPAAWFRGYFIDPAAKALKSAASSIWDVMMTIGDTIWKGLAWFWDKIAAGVAWLSSKVTDLFAAVFAWGLKAAASIRDTFLGILNDIVIPPKETQKEVEQILESALSRTGGVAENLWYIGSELVKPFWMMTIIPFVVRGLVNAIGDAEFSVKIGGTGGSWNVRLGELADALVHGLEMYYSGFGIGLSMGIANMLMVNIGQLYTPRIVQYYDQKIQNILGDVLEQEIKDGATINMFLKPVTEHELIDYARRMLALYEGISNEKTLKALLATVRAYLKIYGLPKWYIDFLTSDPEKLAIKFKDRFGAERKVYLSYIFELPTYSDLARMTQRDIFPDVQTMQRVSWVRGWNEDLTTMMYLLTFNYPSFEKLWSFYMRAVSGMLWFNPPDIMRTVYAIEASQLKAGVPVAPIDLQRALLGPDQVKAFELAINTYFKWMAYSSFSWFTPTTEVYGVNVGQEIVSRLGGWTADSWILADTAADIPGRIDLRWMSRYSIIQYMGDKFNASNVRFESYTPLVDVVPKLIDSSPASNIQLDLRWFSKLLQATGLHPAWVPVVSVAENIMAIADEMSLLRTGWLNLFKEGMINVTDAERYLSGLLVASYQVGFWDPVQKAWTSGWINLPVRWLPHERKLLELRMAIDRVMDIFREAYNYIKSGIRTLSITKEDARQRLVALIDRLNQHYRALTKVITGQEFELKLDSDYIDLWLYAQELAQDIEASERVRVWWSRASGYLIYRIMYGYVTDQDIDSFINTVAKYIPLFPKEVEAYKGIAKALSGIVRKESIPSPSTLATFAEYLVLDPNFIKQTLANYNVPPEYWDLWIKYISVRPVKSDYKSLLSTALKALRYNVITNDDWKKILSDATKFGFTPAELELISKNAELELAIDDAKEYIPSPSTLADMTEYVPEAKNYTSQVLQAKNVRGVWAELWTKYIYLRPLYNDINKWADSMFTLAERSIIDMSQLDPVFKILSSYGWEDLEIEMARRTVLADQVRYAFDDVIGTPRTLADMSRYTDRAADWAFSRAAKLIDALPTDNNTKAVLKEMWKQYITAYQANEEIRSYMDELINAYAYGVLDDAGLEAELDYLRKLGVPELRLALVRRTAYLRRARRAASG
jgi:phage-related protein